jgi:hypothetical protein
MCDKEQILSYVYEELDRSERAQVEAHLRACADCREEVAALNSVRTDLATWTPPQRELGFHIVQDRKPAWRQWWTPAFGLAAAAVLVLAVASAIANVEVSYGSGGFSVRAGRGPAQTAVQVPEATQARSVDAAATLTKADVEKLVDGLDARLRQLEAAPRPSALQQASLKSVRQSDESLLRQVHDLLAQSESKQQQELALRIAQVIRDVDAQRAADLNRIQQGLGRIDAMTTYEAQTHRDLTNYILASSRQQQK